MLKRVIIITIIILALYLVLRKLASRMPVALEVTKKEYIIDVRSQIEWNEWHHPKAIHIPYYEINNIEGIVKNKNDKIILYCQTARRASIARNKLVTMGYKNIEVKNIKQI